MKVKTLLTVAIIITTTALVVTMATSPGIISLMEGIVFLATLTPLPSLGQSIPTTIHKPRHD